MTQITSKPRCSIVIPAKQEDSEIIKVLSRFVEFVDISFECLIIVDNENDLTFHSCEKFIENQPNFKIVVNHLETGPAGAIRSGIEISNSDVIVVTMADGSDDPKQIQNLVFLVERGVAIACASRYMPGGQAIGAPRFKSFLSKISGKSLQLIRNVGTHDATNSFKAYDKNFLNLVKIESKFGFEMGLELVGKAKRYNYPVAELPTIWVERKSGDSKFKLVKWIPKYLQWYFYALNPKKER